MFYTYLHINEKGVFYAGCGGVRRPYQRTSRSLEWKLASSGGYSILIVGEFEIKEDAWRHEVFLISTFSGLVNKYPGGPGPTGITPSAEVRLRMSLTHRGPGNAMYGRSHTTQSKMQISQNKGRLTQSQIQKIRSDPRLHREIGLDYGISRNYVTNIKQGKRGIYA